ncbi:restriction endonuclease subunit S [Glaesserella parasuis]|uniref:restriction endonuclease subunit S n=1 Tax=Glaesserella parasuis TaxID=738 RepID=UPI001365A589|nr:restriction endonuclease subunit S [Glaesserella parasuis]MWP81562.1 restriction endonuclease subunit S [Glaesserella parasuis]
MSKLGDFINVKHGFAFKGEFITTKVNNNCLVTPGNFAIGGGFKSDKFKFYTGEIPREYILEENDLIVTMTDLSKEADTLGYSALVPKIENKIMLHNQRIGLIELKNKNIDKEYLYFLLRSKEYRHHIVSSATGSTVKHTSPSRILSFEFECPSLEYQQWAAKQLMDIERKIQLNTQINQTLEQIAQTIFKSWFIDFDPVHAKANALASGQTLEQATQAAMAVISGKNTQELHRLQTANPEQYQQLWEIAEAFPRGFDEEGVPRGWESKKVGEVAKIVKGKKPKLISSEPDDGFLPHILMASLSGKYTEYAQIDKSIVCDIFDTLILMDGAASGKIAIGHKGVIGSTFAKMELSENKYWALFNQFMFSKEQDIQANTTGTSIPHTDKARVLDYEIIVPCDVVLNYFTEMYKNILCSILNQRKNSFILENIRDLLLPKLLSGEV